MTVCVALIRKSRVKCILCPERCDPSVVTTIYKQLRIVSVSTWHLPTSLLTQGSAKHNTSYIYIANNRKIHCWILKDKRWCLNPICCCGDCNEVVCNCHPRPGSSPLVMLSDWTSLCARGPQGAALSLTWHTGSSEFWQHRVTQDDDKYGE